ncbi:alpha/beta-hydrolase [Cristinia sonorae]|uniref:Alpha/beta-hydrolase n=1 Tax=Cristinia sonorae TaxID=1940300 RepID=A0A8K0UDR2_9AGAR|nr:alpha/beta-hydrolase [Cristinia sonorae]
MSSEKPFSVAIPDTELDLLRKKLELVRFPDELDGAAWDYGVPLADIRRLVERWKTGFDWKAAEAKINQFPQFTRDIDVDGFGELNIHYIHQRSDASNAIPLIFIHGWPGHFMEVSKILPLLVSTTEKYPSFHVVALSLPGYGFSEAPKQKGFSVTQFGEVAHKLMLSLGYDEYVVQGGDWGHLVARNMAHTYGQKHVKAWHTNFPFCQPPSLFKHPVLWIKFMITPFTPRDWAGLKRMTQWLQSGQGYAGIQQTRPQTHGYSMADSPVGLLAWIYDKLVDWTDNYDWDDDEILAWVSIYWFSRAGPMAASRIYAEFVRVGGIPPWSPVPLGVSYFPKEVMPVPKLWTRTIGNVVFESEHSAGGHFAAYEKPQDLVRDLRSMFGKEGGLHLL